ncbi:MAG: Mut7-C RNAse domain-containing protein [Deltaproteobacteria bacterium]|nr:MAG: Mut7-C RNAse domain-containing protein [Deltaproteobacteria bacterium]
MRGIFIDQGNDKPSWWFIVDRTLGKLAKWLRILGYDTIYWRSDDLEGLLRRAKEEGRTLITKDGTVYRRRGAIEALLIREDNPFRQVQLVVRHLQLSIQEEKLFSRCLACNAVLEDVDPQEVRGEVPDYIFHTHQEFSRCPSCRKVYWAGTHYERMTKVVEKLQEGRP